MLIQQKVSNFTYEHILTIIYHKESYDFHLKNISEELMTVSGDSSLYERIRNGFQVLIYGSPNVGKSSLMNYLGN